MKHICRLCLSEKTVLNIFEDDPKIFHMLQLCTDLRMNPDDGLPNNICSPCVSFIEGVISFKEKCEKNDSFLRTRLNSNDCIKRETDESCFGMDDSFDARNSIDAEFISMSCKIEIETTNELLFSEPLDDKMDVIFPEIGLDSENSNVTLSQEIKTDTDGIKKTQLLESTEDKVSENVLKTKRQRRTKTRDLKKRSCKKTNSNEEDFNNFCPFCGLQFKRVTHWETHLRTHNNKPLECNTCNKSYKTRRHLIAHIETHADKKDCQCDLCGGLYRTSSALSRHISWVHNFTMVDCKVCGKLLKSTGMKLHMSIHNKEKNYECDLCHQKFISKDNVKSHIQTHTGNKPYKCRFCPSRFAKRKTFRDHERLHTGERPHKCPECGMVFIQVSNMKSHFKNNHKGVPFVYRKKKIK